METKSKTKSELSKEYIDGLSLGFRKFERLTQALGAYMELRKSQGIGHSSKEGKELSEAYWAWKGVI